MVWGNKKNRQDKSKPLLTKKNKKKSATTKLIKHLNSLIIQIHTSFLISAFKKVFALLLDYFRLFLHTKIFQDNPSKHKRQFANDDFIY